MHTNGNSTSISYLPNMANLTDLADISMQLKK